MSFLKHNRSVVGIAMAAVAVALALMACGRGGPGGAAGGGEPRYFDIEVSVSHLPDLNEPFTVTAKLTATEMDEADAELWMNVTGAVYLDGEDRWHGPLKLGEEKTVSATFAVVTEGNHAASAAANSTDLFGHQTAVPPVWFHTTAEGSALGRGETESDTRVFVPGQEVREVGAGRLSIVDTALLLNTSDAPRIEFVQSESDVVALQEEGLFPKELRYSWRQLNHMDFSRVFLIVYFDQMRPSPGHLPVFKGNFKGNYFDWDDGVLRGSYETFSAPAPQGAAAKPVSAVTMIYSSRDAQPTYSDIMPYQGLRTFEFTIDGGPPTPVQVDFAPLP